MNKDVTHWTAALTLLKRMNINVEMTEEGNVRFYRYTGGGSDAYLDGVPRVWETANYTLSMSFEKFMDLYKKNVEAFTDLAKACDLKMEY